MKIDTKAAQELVQEANRQIELLEVIQERGHDWSDRQNEQYAWCVALVHALRDGDTRDFNLLVD